MRQQPYFQLHTVEVCLFRHICCIETALSARNEQLHVAESWSALPAPRYAAQRVTNARLHHLSFMTIFDKVCLQPDHNKWRLVHNNLDLSRPPYSRRENVKVDPETTLRPIMGQKKSAMHSRIWHQMEISTRFTFRSLCHQVKNPWHLSDERLGGPQSLSACGNEETSTSPIWELNQDSPARAQFPLLS